MLLSLLVLRIGILDRFIGHFNHMISGSFSSEHAFVSTCLSVHLLVSLPILIWAFELVERVKNTHVIGPARFSLHRHFRCFQESLVRQDSLSFEELPRYKHSHVES